MIISFFSGLYWRLTKIYGQSLWYWLAGFDCDMSLTRKDLFFIIGLSCIIVTFVMVLLFYLVNHVKFNGFVSWTIVLLFTAVVNLFIAFGISNNQRPDMPSWAIYGITQVDCPTEDEMSDGFTEDESEDCTCDELVPIDGASPLITSGTCWLFGLANAIVSVVFFVILSFVVKRFSITTRHTPWRSLWPKK